MGVELKELQPTAPVYDGYFADPFAWEFRGEYFAIGTGPAEAAGDIGRTEKIFPLLHSPDFVHWRYAGQAMERPDPTLGNTFWAPAVAYADGRFSLYYSVGYEDKSHQLRVAISEHALGPYRDAGVTLLGKNAGSC